MPSPLLNTQEARFARLASQLPNVNPFLPERVELERQLLENRFEEAGHIWHATPHYEASTNAYLVGQMADAMVESRQQRVAERNDWDKRDLQLYEGLVVYSLFHRFEETLRQLSSSPYSEKPVTVYDDFLQHYTRLYRPLADRIDHPWQPDHLFACFFQVRRTFDLIFHSIIGSSMAIARLRAAVWQSVFSHDMQRYRRSLYRRMGDIATLVLGPTGTGKESVARAVGLSRYIPFNVQTKRFSADHREGFFPLNLSALSVTLIESELFGHRRGAFTGAVTDRTGWFEQCSELGTVFLDEIGDVEPLIQVKLLRVLQTRSFNRLGETRERAFRGKLVTATNRNLQREIERGAMREDFYYRMCADIIQTPSLAAQIQESPDTLATLVPHLAIRVIGEEEADNLADEVLSWIAQNMPRDYPWPGNVRELEQCVRNIMLRGHYQPPRASGGYRERMARHFLAGEVSVDQLLTYYCTLDYQRTGSYSETGRRLGLDRRTVKAKVDLELLQEP